MATIMDKETFNNSNFEDRVIRGPAAATAASNSSNSSDNNEDDFDCEDGDKDKKDDAKALISCLTT